MSLKYISTYSLAIPFIISIIRYKKLDERFNPFIWVIWLGMATEAINTLLLTCGQTNVWVTNIYVLIEALLLCELFRRWQLFSHHQWFYSLLMGFIIAGWLLELLVRGSLYPTFSIFIICSSFFLVFTSIQGVNTVLFKEPTHILKNPIFVLSIGFILFFTMAILLEMFWFYGLTKSRFFRIRVYQIFMYVNLITNFIYAYALLWIPLKRHYLLQS
jgi:hypothetical protein